MRETGGHGETRSAHVGMAAWRGLRRLWLEAACILVTRRGGLLTFFSTAPELVGSQFHNQGPNLGPRRWKLGSPNHWTAREFPWGLFS